MERQGKIRPALFSGLPKLSTILEWSAADKCLLFAGVLFPFYLGVLALGLRFLANPTYQQFFNLPYLRWSLSLNAVAVALWIVLAALALVSRKSHAQHPLFVHATIQLYSIPNAVFAAGVGYETSPWPMLALLGVAPIGFLFFGTGPTVGGMAGFFAVLGLAGILEALGLLPYAFFLREGHAFVNGRPWWGWTVTIGMGALLAAIIAAAIIGYVVERLRVRERNLFQANAALQRAEEELWLGNESLELRVEERTRQLSHANVALQAEIHRRQDLEDQLRQSAKMEAVGRFTGGIAHDFNNVLTIIDGYTSLLLLRMKSGTKDFEDISHLAKGTLRARDLAKKLLAFSRKEAVQMRPLDLNTVLNAMRGLVARAAGEAIRVRFELGDGLNPIRADPGQLEQILLNLAVNARDAMPGNGELSIRTQAVTRGAEELGGRKGEAGPEPYVLLSVSDTGMGMDAETIEKIFDPFFTTKDVGKGTGLGLSTVYGIVQQSGGHIEVASEIGKGTEFKLYFPMAESAQLPTLAAPETAAAPRRGMETILAVEDDPALLMLMRQVLQNLGYRVLAAGSPQDACALAQEHAGKINLLLTDLVMPWMNGRELAQRLRLASPGLRVIFTSGYTADAAILAEIREMKVPFLPKPFQPDELGRKVREVLDAEAP